MKLDKAIISLTIAMLLVPQITVAQDRLKESNKPAAADQQNNTGREELMPLLKLFEALNNEKYFEKPLGKEAKDRILKAVETSENKWVIKYVQNMENRGIGLVPALYAMKAQLDVLSQGDIVDYLEKVERDIARFNIEEERRQNKKIDEREELKSTMVKNPSTENIRAYRKKEAELFGVKSANKESPLDKS